MGLRHEGLTEHFCFKRALQNCHRSLTTTVTRRVPVSMVRHAPAETQASVTMVIGLITCPISYHWLLSRSFLGDSHGFLHILSS